MIDDSNTLSGYDIIGDIHGQYEVLFHPLVCMCLFFINCYGIGNKDQENE